MDFYDGYKIMTVDEFTVPSYELLGTKRKKKRIYNCISVLDIETSHNHNLDDLHTWIYQWAWLLNDTIVIGRTKEEIIKLIHKLQDANNDGYYRTFIHNLPYEYSYLWFDLNEEFTQTDKLFASAPHKPFKVQYGNMEFMCSYKLSNRSLSAWGKYYDVKHKKIDNGIDYNAIHYPTDELTEEDWLYMYHDVICPKECLIALMNEQNMRYDQLLMTSTMFVKNEVTKKFKRKGEWKRNHFAFSKNALDYNSYKVLRKSFVGGITHANWSILGKTVKGNIQHYDFDSHYPTQMITKKFPMGKVTLVDDIKGNRTLNEFSPNNTYAYWVVCTFENLRLKDDLKCTMPYISVSKCDGIYNCTNVLKDNGRLVSSEGYTTLYLSSYDIKWLLKQYTADDYIISKVYRSALDYLPAYLRDTILECYQIKSVLKVKLAELENEGKEDTDEYRTIKTDYNKSKNILNGLYGVNATDPIRDEIIFNAGEWTVNKIHNDIEEIENKLKKHYESYEHWTRYEFGTWVTSLARDELMACIELVGYENYLYCDTDSIFFIATDENMQAIEKLNKEWLEDSINNNYCVDVNGKNKYMHKFDGEIPLKAFRTMGAKCYAYITQDNIFDCVIAGVPARKTYIIDGKEVTYKRQDELGSIDNLKEGFVFSKCCPTTSVYTDEGCVILNTTHTISLAETDGEIYYQKV